MSRPVEITEEGSFIPASQRPDGSWRKQRRVKDGYVPQEEVPLYESKGKQLANHQGRQYPVGLDPSIIKAREEAKAAANLRSIPGLQIDSEATKKKKNKKKKAVENGISESQSVKNPKTNPTLPSAPKPNEEWQTVPSKGSKTVKTEPAFKPKPPPISVFDPAKRLKNLKKKVREIETIEAKIASGEIKNPEKDQLEKVSRKAEILSDILALELNLGQ